MLNYIIPASLNDSQKPEKLRRRRALHRKKKMQSSTTLTFTGLASILADRGAHSLQTTANLNSALRGFLGSLGLRENAVIGSTLRASYYRNLRKHIEFLQAQNRKPSYIANRKHSLGVWRSLLLELDRIDAAIHQNPSPLQMALQDLFNQGFQQKKVARDVGISLASLKRWLAGATPNARAIPSLHRLEVFFGLEPGALVELAQGKVKSTATSVGESAPIAYRRRLSAQSKEPYVFKDASPLLREQWMALVKHKSEVLPFLLRQRTGRWSKTTKAVKAKDDSLWYCFNGDEYVASADIYWRLTARYFGWMTLPNDKGGAGLNSASITSLAQLCIPSFLHAFVVWQSGRADGAYHSGIKNFVCLVRSLVHPATGYITQSPQLAASLPESMRPTDWKVFCAETFSWANRTISHISQPGIDIKTTARDPFEPIKAVLDLPVPSDAIADMVARMKAARPITGGIREAIWSRDILLTALLMSNPLRAKNIILMTYSPDNQGNLYQNKDGSWWLYFPKPAFKNFSGAAKDREYKTPIEPAVWPYIELYLQQHRVQLPYADELNYVFLSSEAGDRPCPWKSMNRRIEILTRRYLWCCPGIGPHGFRHIIATSILKASPNDWATAARILHDKPETVEQHYAHLKVEDGQFRMFNLLESSFSRL